MTTGKLFRCMDDEDSVALKVNERNAKSILHGKDESGKR